MLYNIFSAQLPQNHCKYISSSERPMGSLKGGEVTHPASGRHKKGRVNTRPLTDSSR